MLGVVYAKHSLGNAIKGFPCACGGAPGGGAPGPEGGGGAPSRAE